MHINGTGEGGVNSLLRKAPFMIGMRPFPDPFLSGADQTDQPEPGEIFKHISLPHADWWMFSFAARCIEAQLCDFLNG